MTEKYVKYSAEVIADSVNPNNERVTTLQIRMPLCVWAEFLTHRSFARNARSNRAVPSKILIREVINNPFVPEFWGKNKSGMQAGEELTGWRKALAIRAWLTARWAAVIAVWIMSRCGLHKQDANRVLAPWQWVDAVVTGDQIAWNTFWGLRAHPDADPKISKIAVMIREKIWLSVPTQLKWGEWHRPYYSARPYYKHSEDSGVNLNYASAGACARVSYRTFDGKQSDKENEQLTLKLLSQEPKHSSPLEHVIEAVRMGEWYYRIKKQCVSGDWITLRTHFE